MAINHHTLQRHTSLTDDSFGLPACLPLARFTRSKASLELATLVRGGSTELNGRPLSPLSARNAI